MLVDMHVVIYANDAGGGGCLDGPIHWELFVLD